MSRIKRRMRINYRPSNRIFKPSRTCSPKNQTMNASASRNRPTWMTWNPPSASALEKLERLNTCSTQNPLRKPSKTSFIFHFCSRTGVPAFTPRTTRAPWCNPSPKLPSIHHPGNLLSLSICAIGVVLPRPIKWIRVWSLIVLDPSMVLEDNRLRNPRRRLPSKRFTPHYITV